MKHLPLILLSTLSISGCDFDSDDNNDKISYNPDLIGVWRSANQENENYVIINKNSYKQLEEVDALNCHSTAINSPYITGNEKIILTNGSNSSQRYELKDGQLTLTDEDNHSAQYTLISEEIPNLEYCNGTDLKGIWEFTNPELRGIIVFDENKSQNYYKREELLCATKSNEYVIAAHDGKIAFKDSDLGQDYRRYEHLYTYTKLNDELFLTFEPANPEEPHIEELIRVPEDDFIRCEDKSSSRVAEIKITFQNLPNGIQEYLDNIDGERNDYKTELSFDIDNDGTLSSRDIVLSLTATTQFNNDGSRTQSIEATLKAMIVHGQTKNSFDYDIPDFTIKDNTITLLGRASDIAWIKEINNTTPISVTSVVYNGYRINDDNFRLVAQHSDYYPAYNEFTSNENTLLLEDALDDVTGQSDQPIIVDIHKIEVTIKE